MIDVLVVAGVCLTVGLYLRARASARTIRRGRPEVIVQSARARCARRVAIPAE